MRPQLTEMIASKIHPFKWDGKSDEVAQQFSSPFVTAGRHESFIFPSLGCEFFGAFQNRL